MSDATWWIDQAYQGANADDALVFFTGARYLYLGENETDSWRQSLCSYVNVDESAPMQSTPVESSRFSWQVISGSCRILP